MTDELSNLTPEERKTFDEVREGCFDDSMYAGAEIEGLLRTISAERSTDSEGGHPGDARSTRRRVRGRRARRRCRPEVPLTEELQDIAEALISRKGDVDTWFQFAGPWGHSALESIRLMRDRTTMLLRPRSGELRLFRAGDEFRFRLYLHGHRVGAPRIDVSARVESVRRRGSRVRVALAHTGPVAYSEAP